ncbi:hypothetical protein FA95DRAFT_1465870, partial [Auriscalpium vulgare]
LGEGHREQMWIWKAMPHDARDLPGQPENIMCVGLRVDWAKARARVRRWDEEIKLLQAEMPRAVTFLRFKANWWTSRAGLRANVTADIRDGLYAYAARHSAMYNKLADEFQALW